MLYVMKKNDFRDLLAIMFPSTLVIWLVWYFFLPDFAVVDRVSKQEEIEKLYKELAPIEWEIRYNREAKQELILFASEEWDFYVEVKSGKLFYDWDISNISHLEWIIDLDIRLGDLINQRDMIESQIERLSSTWLDYLGN